MAAQWLFCNTLICLLILFLAPHLSKSVDSSTELPHFSFSWPDDDDEFYTNDTVAIKVQVPENYNPEEYKFPLNPDISVNETKGNSSYISDLHSDFGNDTKNWQILFKPIMAGFFHVLITDDHFRVYDASLHFHVAPAESYIPPRFSFNWPNDIAVFRVGELVYMSVTTYDNFNPKTYKHPFNPNLILTNDMGQDEKAGNSSYITGFYNTGGHDTNKFMIHFIPIMVGRFFIWIHQKNLGIDFPGAFYSATPGEIYLPGGIVSWMGDDNHFVAGTNVTVKILPKDVFCNDVTQATEGYKWEDYNFTVFATYSNGSEARVSNVINGGINGHGYITIVFTVITSGSLLLHVKYENLHLVGSPLSFTVDPGPLVVGNCMPWWHIETTSFQLFSTMETFVSQRDQYGNLVPGFYDFNFEVVERSNGMAVPIGDLQNKEVVPGIRLFSFKLLSPGELQLIITDRPYCDGLKSIVNGSGLESSMAGEVSKFSILLRDAYDYPSPLELHRLRVDITLPGQSVHVEPKISPIVNGTQSTGMFNFGAFDPSVPFVYSQSGEVSKTLQSHFEVEFVPEKMGMYEIHVFCGNIPLNDGNPYTKSVSASDKVNGTTSRLLKYEKQASNLVVHEIGIELRDSYHNPVVLPDSKMTKFSLESQMLPLTVIMFLNHKNGSYFCFYMPMVLDQYYMCMFFDGNRINPCPFTVDIYNTEDFPISYDDEVSCWEDESIGFDALKNDYAVSGKAKVVGFEKPRHGSVVLYGNTFRYTPFKRYYGNDSFTYSMSDVNGNITSSSKVNVFVLPVPPQFVTYPRKLLADEDMFSPKFGGFPGFELTYSISKEHISVSFSAKRGSVFLSPLLIQLWDPMWDELSITRMEGKNNELILTARMEVINFAVKSLKYIGDRNYSGEDIIRVTTINKNGKRDLDIPISVNPINDPPFINAPEFIILGNVTEDEGYLIFDTQRDNFTFFIGDPDYPPFPVEVSSGYFSVSLPAVLISTTELKLKNSNQWQPLLTFVEISKQFTVKVKAIRFRGTIEECNTVLQQIFYYVDEDDVVLKRGGVLKVSVNDMGWYGCYPDCEEMMMSAPLITEATIKLVAKTPVDVVVAHSLGSVIVIEFILLSSLAVMLIFFTCKCVYLLLHKKVTNQDQFQMKSSYAHMSSTDSSDSEDMTMTGQPSSLPNPVT